MLKALLIFPALALATPADAQQMFIRRAAITDGSGTVTTGAAAQQVFAADPERSYLFCQNPITATEPLFVNIGSLASVTAASYELAAGGTLTMSVPFVFTGSISVTAVTTGHRFVCKAG